MNSNEDPDRQVLKLSLYPEISSMSGQRLLTTTPVKHGTRIRQLSKKSQTKTVQSYLQRNMDCFDAERDCLAPTPRLGNEASEKVCGKTAKQWYQYLRSVTPNTAVSTEPSSSRQATDRDTINHRPNTTRMVPTGHPSKRVGKLYIGYAGAANIGLCRQQTL